MKKKFEVKGMTCAACQRHVENTVSKIEGVTNCEVSLLSNSMSLEFDENIVNVEKIADSLTDIGYELVIDSKKDDWL